MVKFTLILGVILNALGVGIGAFGAHALKNLLELNERTQTFETAVKYHFYHSLGILFIGVLMLHIQSKLLDISVYLMFAGILLFSGSLYTLCITNLRFLGAITPLGGLCFIAAWVMVAVAILKAQAL